MPVDGAAADDQHLADLLARVALGDQLDDVGLARSQRTAVALLGRGGELGDRRPRHPRMDERAAPQRPAAGLDQVAVGRRLEDVAIRARLERGEEVLLVVVHREHHDANVGALADHLAGDVDAGHPRHRYVEHREVEITGQHCAQRFDAVARDPGDLEVGRRVDDESEPVADHLVIVGEEDPRFQGDRHVSSPRLEAAGGRGFPHPRRGRSRSARRRARPARACP